MIYQIGWAMDGVERRGKLVSARSKFAAASEAKWVESIPAANDEPTAADVGTLWLPGMAREWSPEMQSTTSRASATANRCEACGAWSDRVNGGRATWIGGASSLRYTAGRDAARRGKPTAQPVRARPDPLRRKQRINGDSPAVVASSKSAKRHRDRRESPADSTRFGPVARKAMGSQWWLS